MADSENVLVPAEPSAAQEKGVEGAGASSSSSNEAAGAAGAAGAASGSAAAAGLSGDAAAAPADAGKGSASSSSSESESSDSESDDSSSSSDSDSSDEDSDDDARRTADARKKRLMKKKGKRAASKYFEDEAEQSGSDVSSDEDESEEDSDDDSDDSDDDSDSSDEGSSSSGGSSSDTASSDSDDGEGKKKKGKGKPKPKKISHKKKKAQFLVRDDDEEEPLDEDEDKDESDSESDSGSSSSSSGSEDKDGGKEEDDGEGEDEEGGEASGRGARRKRLLKLQQKGGAAALSDDDLELIREAAERGDVDADLAAKAPLAKRMRTDNGQPKKPAAASRRKEEGRGEDLAKTAAEDDDEEADDAYDSDELADFIEQDEEYVAAQKEAAAAKAKNFFGDAAGAGRKRKASEMLAGGIGGGADGGYRGGGRGIDREAAQEFDQIFGAGARAVIQERLTKQGINITGRDEGDDHHQERDDEGGGKQQKSKAARKGFAALYSDSEDDGAGGGDDDDDGDWKPKSKDKKRSEAAIQKKAQLLAAAAAKRGGVVIAGSGAIGGSSSAVAVADARDALLRSAYEPAVLSAHLVGRRDREIREKDVPERLQTSLKARLERRERIAAGIAAFERAASAYLHRHHPELADQLDTATSAVETAVDDAGRDQATEALEALKVQRTNILRNLSLNDKLSNGFPLAGILSDRNSPEGLHAESEALWIASRLMMNPEQSNLKLGIYDPDHDISPTMTTANGLTLSCAVEQGVDPSDPKRPYTRVVRFAEPVRVTMEQLAACVYELIIAFYSEALDVPFLWTYRKEKLLNGELSLGHLWSIFDQDEVWTRIAARKLAVASALDMARSLHAADRETLARFYDLLIQAQTERQVEDVGVAAQQAIIAIAASKGLDVDAILNTGSSSSSSSAASSGAGNASSSSSSKARRSEFQALFGDDDESEDQDSDSEQQKSGRAGSSSSSSSSGGSAAVTTTGTAGVASRQDFYRMGHTAGLGKVCNAIFMSASSLASNLRVSVIGMEGMSLHRPPTGFDEDPEKQLPHGGDRQAIARAIEKIARDSVSSFFDRAESVLPAAVHIASVDIAREPYIRSYVRRRLFEMAYVATAPTDKGRSDIDATHPVFGLQRLRKRLGDFGRVVTARPSTHYVEPLEVKANAPKPAGMQTLTSEDDPSISAVDDEYPSLKWETQPAPSSDAFGVNAGWGSHLAQKRLLMAQVAPIHDPVTGAVVSPGGTVAKTRLEARVGGYTQFAAILKAESQGLVKVTIDVDDGAADLICSELCALYLSTEGSMALSTPGVKVTQPSTLQGLLDAADDHRRAAVVLAVTRFLLPETIRDVRAQLVRVANEALAGEYAAALRRRLMMQPPQPPPQPLRKTKDSTEAAKKAAEGASAMQVDGSSGQADDENLAILNLGVPAGPSSSNAFGHEFQQANGSKFPRPDCRDLLHLVRYPWQTIRPRVAAIALPRPGVDASAQQGNKHGATAGIIVMLNAKGDFDDFALLPPRGDARETAIAEFLFSHAPDMLVIGAGGGTRVKEVVQRNVFAAALKCESLVRTARANYKKRRALLKRISKESRDEVTDLSKHPDASVRGEWQEAAFTGEQAHLEIPARKWCKGIWRMWRPRMPALVEQTHTESGRREVVSGHDVPAAVARATLHVHVLEDEIPRVFATSARGKAEFPDHSPLLRYAVSLGRYSQDPVAETAYIWAKRADDSLPGVKAALAMGVAACPSDLLSLRIHGLQAETPQRLLYAAAERVMVEVVNSVGVHVNLAYTRQHLAEVLQFVGGLGPRKASVLKSVLQREGIVRSRSQLVINQLLSQIVFQNAAGFLRILPATAGLSSGRYAGHNGGLRPAGNKSPFSAGISTTNAFGSDDALATLSLRRKVAEQNRLAISGGSADDDSEDEEAVKGKKGKGKKAVASNKTSEKKLQSCLGNVRNSKAVLGDEDDDDASDDEDEDEDVNNKDEKYEDGDLARDFTAFHPLDSTRIHPETYRFILHLAAAADLPELKRYLPGRYRGIFNKPEDVLTGDPDSFFDFASSTKDLKVSSAAAGTYKIDEYEDEDESEADKQRRYMESNGMDITADVSAHAQQQLALFLRRHNIPFSSWSPRLFEPDDAFSKLQLEELAVPISKMENGGVVFWALQLAKTEFRAPFRDARRPYERPTAEALFRMLTHESSTSFRVGLRLPVRIERVMDKRLAVTLDNGLRGDIFVDRAALDSRREGEKLTDYYQEGRIITARLTHLDRSKMLTGLCTLPFLAEKYCSMDRNTVLTAITVTAAGKLIDASLPQQATNMLLALSQNPPPFVDASCEVDKCLRDQLEVALQTASAAKVAALESGASAAMMAALAGGIAGGGAAAATAGGNKTGVVLRAIAHPLFQNILREDANRYLSEQPLYSCVFRPSSLGTDHLTISWKIAEPNIVVHLDVLEEGKEGMAPTALGKRLYLDHKNYCYSDLDEVLARHIEPMASLHAQLRAAARVYRDAPQDHVDAEIKQSLADNPSRIPYLISPNATALGTYTISFMVKTSVHREPVVVTPAGYKWRGVVSPNWHKLIEDFKARCRTRPQQPTQAAAVPAGAAPSFYGMQQYQQQPQYQQPAAVTAVAAVASSSKPARWDNASSYSSSSSGSAAPAAAAVAAAPRTGGGRWDNTANTRAAPAAAAVPAADVSGGLANYYASMQGYGAAASYGQGYYGAGGAAGAAAGGIAAANPYAAYQPTAAAYGGYAAAPAAAVATGQQPQAQGQQQGQEMMNWSSVI